MGRVMSLTSFLDMRDVIERVKPLRPTSPRNPEFPAVEEWFFQRAKEVFPPIAPLSSRSLRKPRPH